MVAEDRVFILRTAMEAADHERAAILALIGRWAVEKDKLNNTRQEAHTLRLVAASISAGHHRQVITMPARRREKGDRSSIGAAQ